MIRLFGHPLKVGLPGLNNTAAEQQQPGHERRLPVVDRPEPNTVRQRDPLDLGKPKRRHGADRRQARTVHAHQVVVTGVEPGSAASADLVGTTLNATRVADARWVAAAERTLAMSACAYRSRSALK